MLKLQRSSPPEHELNDYRERGFCVARGLLSEAAVRTLRENAERFIRDDMAKLGGRDVNYVDAEKKIVNSIHKLHADAFFSAVMNDSDFAGYAAAFLGEGVKGRAVEMFAKPANTGLKVPLHQDNAYWCMTPPNALTAWIAIDGADFTNGGVYYVEGSHKLGSLSHGASFAPGSSQEQRDRDSLAGLTVTCPAILPGDVFFHHVLTSHWSEPNKSARSRRGITLQYVGASTKEDLALKKAYEAALQEQIRLRETQPQKG